MAGVVIALKPVFNNQQLKNCSGCFTASACCSLIVILWGLRVLRDAPKDQVNTKEQSVEGLHQLQPEDCNESSKLWTTIKEMFHYKNFAGFWTVCVKKREGSIRLRMWLIILTINLTQLPVSGRSATIFPLVQKLYKWDAVVYSNLNTISGILHIIGMLAIIPILFRYLKVNDCETSILGTLMGIIGDVFIGSIISPWGFYLHAFITSFDSGASTGCRTYLAKLLPKDEVAKAFAITQLMEAGLKSVASFSFAYILKMTIGSYPSFVFHFMGVILITALVVLVYVDLITPGPFVESKIKVETQTDTDSRGRNLSLHQID